MGVKVVLEMEKTPTPFSPNVKMWKKSIKSGLYLKNISRKKKFKNENLEKKYLSCNISQ